MFDIGFGSKNEVEKKLSNFNPNPFVFDGVACTCLEGPLQAFKTAKVAEQIRICGLSGKEAKKAGREHNTWKLSQQLHWNGVVYNRTEQPYQDVLNRLFLEALLASEDRRRILQKSGNKPLTHTIGSHDPHDTVLTITELTSRLYESREYVRIHGVHL